MNPTRPVFNFANLVGDATQSCTEHDSPASLAIDDNTDENWHNGSVSHTCTMLQAWWRVDFGVEVNIHKIIVWNRMDWGSWRLNDSDVIILDNNDNEVASNHIVLASEVAKFEFEYPDETIGSAVMVKLRTTAEVNLAEVQVLSHDSPV